MYMLLIRKVTLVPILIFKRALLILQNEAVSASNLQLLLRKRKVFYKILTYALRAISIILKY
jgi:hypothetical protein